MSEVLIVGAGLAGLACAQDLTRAGVACTLLEASDVFVENFAPGVIERLGFGYEAVNAINSRIVYAQIKGFAPDGP